MSNLSENIIILSFLAAAVVVLVMMIVLLHRRINRLTQGRSGANLEQTILDLGKSVRATEKVNELIKNHLTNIEERLRKSVQHVKTVRFNPFRDRGQGGDQSFATALLDEEGDGVVISGLYAQERMHVYAKPIEKKASKYELTAEEKAALNK